MKGRYSMKPSEYVFQKHISVPMCCDCGRRLEPGEKCDCSQRVGTKDGLRAKCPQFGFRSSYRGWYYIKCGDKKLRFRDMQERNAYYAGYCCNNCEECERRLGK